MTKILQNKIYSYFGQQAEKVHDVTVLTFPPTVVSDCS